MENVDPDILAIEARAAEAKVSMPKVLADAEVAQSTWWRWRHGGVEPRLGTLRKVRQALDRRLEKERASPEPGVAAA